jgi:hypothetical protein
VTTVALSGIEAVPVEVQVSVAAGMPAFAVVGLADNAIAVSRLGKSLIRPEANGAEAAGAALLVGVLGRRQVSARGEDAAQIGLSVSSDQVRQSISRPG